MVPFSRFPYSPIFEDLSPFFTHGGMLDRLALAWKLGLNLPSAVAGAGGSIVPWQLPLDY